MAPAPSRMSAAAAALVAAALFASGAAPASGAGLRRGAAALATVMGPPRTESPSPLGEGSKIIEGEDCGRAKLVVSKYAKASKVGELAGKANGAIAAAAAVKETAAVDVTKAKELSTHLGGSAVVDDQVGKVEEASTELDTASGNLQTELDTFKGKASGSEFAGEDVEQADMTKLRKLTEELADARELVAEKAKRLQAVVKKAAEASKAAGAEATEAAGKVLTEVDAKVKEGKELAQKAGWAEGDADALVTKANTAATDVQAAGDKAGDQKPVYEALKTSIDEHVAGVTDKKGVVTTAKAALETALTALDGALLTPLKDAQKDVASGKPASDTLQKDLEAVEKALADVATAKTDLEGAMEGLKVASTGLKAKLDEAEKKLA